MENWWQMWRLQHIIWAMSWDDGTYRPPSMQSSNAHAQPSSGPRCLIFVRPFVYFHTSCGRTVKALVRLPGCAGSPEPSLVVYVISTIISWAGSFMIFHVPCTSYSLFHKCHVIGLTWRTHFSSCSFLMPCLHPGILTSSYPWQTLFQISDLKIW